MAARKSTAKDNDNDKVEAGPGYHGHDAADRGYDSRPEDVATFAEHVELDHGVTVHKGGVEAVGVDPEKTDD